LDWRLKSVTALVSILDFGLAIGNFRFSILDFGLAFQISNFEFRIVVLGLKNVPPADSQKQKSAPAAIFFRREFTGL